MGAQACQIHDMSSFHYYVLGRQEIGDFQPEVHTYPAIFVLFLLDMIGYGVFGCQYRLQVLD